MDKHSWLNPSTWITLPRSKKSWGLWEAAAVLCVAKFQQLNQSKSLGGVIKYKHSIIVIQEESMHIRKWEQRQNLAASTSVTILNPYDLGRTLNLSETQFLNSHCVSQASRVSKKWINAFNELFSEEYKVVYNPRSHLNIVAICLGSSEIQKETFKGWLCHKLGDHLPSSLLVIVSFTLK